MNGTVHNRKLAELLRKRGLGIGELGALIPGGLSRTHLSLTLNGVRPLKAPTDGGESKPLTKTWRLIKGVLDAEEFAVAMAFANEQRVRLGLPVLVDQGAPVLQEASG